MKFINKKRIATTVLAGTMALSMAVPAFAANETKITAKYADVKIDVTVPTTGTATINPYKLDVDLKMTDETKSATIKGQQIVTQPLALVNKTTMKLDVDATVTGTQAGAFTFSSSPVAADETGNLGYVFLEAKASSLTKTAMEDGKLNQDALNVEFAGWAASATAPATALVLSTDAVKKGDGVAALVTLNPGTKNSEGGVDVGSGGIALFRLGGSVATAPDTAWKTTDGFTATIAFTFTPNTGK